MSSRMAATRVPSFARMSDPSLVPRSTILPWYSASYRHSSIRASPVHVRPPSVERRRYCTKGAFCHSAVGKLTQRCHRRVPFPAGSANMWPSVVTTTRPSCVARG